MGIGFYADIGDPPKIRVYADERYPLFEPEEFNNDPCWELDSDGRYYYDEPQFICEDFNNATARNILRALNLPDDESGYVILDELPKLRKAAIVTMNSKSRQAEYTRSPSVLKEPGRVTMYVGGFSPDQLLRGLQRVVAVIDEAQKRLTGIYWG